MSGQIASKGNGNVPQVMMEKICMDKIFVGRKTELEQFKEVLRKPEGQAVVVMGQMGMGKTCLLNKMVQIGENHPELECGWVRYEVTPTDGVDSTMALMMDNAFEAAQLPEGSFDGTPRRLKQWRSLLNVLKIGDLVLSLVRNPQGNTRDQFMKHLRLISEQMPENGRAVFVIDPEKYMQQESDQSWAIVVKALPEKIKFVFAQRPEDMLVRSEAFGGLGNVAYIPEKRLSVLDKKTVAELIDLRAAEIGYTATQLEKVLSRYEGHPYLIQAALDLLEAGTGLEELPDDPGGIGEAQLQKIREKGENAIRLFKAYAILEVGVPDDVVEAVSGIDGDTREHLLADKYLGGLLRDEGGGVRIYHAILADYILEQMSEKEEGEYHKQAVEIYREKLATARKTRTKPDELAATRLAEHVLMAEGKEAFLAAFLNECSKMLWNLGLLDTFISLSERALKMVATESAEEAMVTGNLGLIYQTRGELEKAEDMHKKSLEMEERLGLQKGMAGSYINLGVIYRIRGELDKAEDMYKKSLEIAERLGLQEEIANSYGNLGVIYRIRGELDKAEDMHKKSLEIAERLGLQEEMAISYSNLGLSYKDMGELEKAEDMYKKSLEIDERLGLHKGIANSYGNLGLVYRRRGELDKARGYFEKARDLYKKIGVPHMIAKVQKWLDELEV